jgi:beta-N-acetylhexosaminidase
MEDLDKILGKLFLIGIHGTSLNNENMKVLNAIKPGGIIFFSRNIQDKYQLSKFIEDIKNFLGYEPLFGIDQEGGMVTRLENGFSIVPSAMAISATDNKSNAYLAANLLAKEMLAVGIDWNYAPVVDINDNPLNSAIGIRSFSDNKDVVVKFGTQFVKGLQDGGVLSCLKHFPGIGNVNIDPHLDLPQSNLSKEELMMNELYPFLNINSPCWMPTHIYLPKIQTKKEPVSISKEILTDLIRKELNFKGVLVADDLEMGGVSNFYSAKEASLKALNAGMDIVTICHSFEEQAKAKEAILFEYKNNKNFKKKLDKALERIDNLHSYSRYLKNEANFEITIEEVGCKKHLETMQNICDSSITFLSEKNSLSEKISPLRKPNNIFYFLKPKNKVGIEDKESKNIWIINQISSDFDLHPIDLSQLKKEEVSNLSKNSKNLIFSENAYLNSEISELIISIATVSKETLLVALRNPYDAFLPHINYGLCSYGYQINAQQSLYKTLKGEINPVGKLPIDRRFKYA